MKKIALLLIVVLLGTAALAAAKPAPAASSPSSSSQGFVGVSLNLIPCAPFAAPSARFSFGSWSLDAGGSLTNNPAGTSITIFAKGEIPISKIGSDLQTYWAPQICLLSPPGGGSTTNISVFLGAEYMFAPQLAIFADLTAFSLTSAGGATTWTIGANAGQVYTGGRFYF